jgi:hypothetical protein
VFLHLDIVTFASGFLFQGSKRGFPAIVVILGTGPWLGLLMAIDECLCICVPYASAVRDFVQLASSI